MSAISSLYLMSGRLCVENSKILEYWNRWYGVYSQFLEIVAVDIQDLVLETNETWMEYFQRWQLFVSSQWHGDNLIKLSAAEPSKQRYEEVVKQNMSIFLKCKQQLKDKIGQQENIRCLDALSDLIEHLQSNRQLDSKPIPILKKNSLNDDSLQYW